MTGFISWFLLSYLLVVFAFSCGMEPSFTSFPDLSTCF